jgi:nitronate monooxygenase
VRRIQELLDIELPIIQAPTVGFQGSGLVLAMSEAGGLGSLRCWALNLDAMRAELVATRGERGSRSVLTSVTRNQHPIRSAKPPDEGCSRHTIVSTVLIRPESLRGRGGRRFSSTLQI